MNGAVLHRIREADGAFVHPRDLGLGAAALGAELDEIERFGFALERHPYLGVAWRGPAPRLCPDQIKWDLGTRRVGRRVAVWNRVGSTNDLAAAAATSASNEGLVVLAEEQTSGRGRRGRSWVAPAGSSLLMSVLLFPKGAISRPEWLTALGAVAVASVVSEAAGCEARIKWPNDVRVAGRKLAGILVERGVGSVVGIGLNVNGVEGDLPEELRHVTTSLRQITACVMDRSDLARALIRRIDALYDEGDALGPGPLAQAWRDRLEPVRREVAISTVRGEVRGRVVAADLIRGLMVERPGADPIWVDHAAILGLDDEAVGRA